MLRVFLQDKDLDTALSEKLKRNLYRYENA